MNSAILKYISKNSFYLKNFCVSVKKAAYNVRTFPNKKKFLGFAHKKNQV